MSYQLGIDLGTTYTAAAVCRLSDRGSQVDSEVVTLGTRSATVASVLYFGADGSVLVGEAAERRALTDPDRVVREFKRRIGDDTPIIVGGTGHQAHDLAARMISWVVARVAEREGGPATRIAITHPASWGTHRKELLGGALRTAGLSVTFLAEPQAAAVSYASAERVESGSTIAVYDLGGGTFDAAVVRKNGGFTLLGQPEGIDRLGGIDFNEAVFEHVSAGLGEALETMDVTDPSVLTAVARLRRECVEAKEALSSDTEVTIPVLLPELRTQARLTRGEFEGMIRPQVEETVDALGRAVASAGLAPADLSVVLLVGGSSRIPLVAELVSDTFDRPVAVDADPKNAIALGAALAITPQPTGRHAAAAGGEAPNTPPSGMPENTPTPPRGAPSPTGGHQVAGAAGVAGLAAAAGIAGTGVAAAAQSGPGATGAMGAPAGTAGFDTGPGGGAPGGGSAWPSGPSGGSGFGGAGGGGPNWPYESPPPEQTAQTAYVPHAAPVPSRPAVSYERPPVEPPPRRRVGLLIGVGGLLAIAAIIGTIALWPNPVPASTIEPLSSQQTTQQVPTTTTAAVAPQQPNNNVAPRVTTTPPKTATTTKPTTASAAPPAGP
jgi:actin-like ATPase involved in cell morphogenesis